MSSTPRRLLAVLCACAALGASAALSERASAPRIAAQIDEADRDRFASMACGTRPADRVRGEAVDEPIPDGAPVSFVQAPAVLSPAHEGEVRLRALTMAGDVETLRFRRWDADPVAGPVETWPRVGTDAVAGRLVSLFEPAWPNDVVRQRLRSAMRGWDYPAVYWGAIVIGPDEAPVEHAVYLRLSSTAMPRAAVVRLDDSAQYASHVVNLVVPDFGATRVAASRDFVESLVTRRFYEIFGDDYDTIAIVPQEGHFASYWAYHRPVQNAVRGIGLDLFDETSRYGSRGRLQGVQVFLGPWFATARTTNHEFAHQWGHYFAWDRIMALARAGWEPDVHTPLVAPAETYIGALLRGTRRVGTAADGGFRIERVPAPVRHHPLELYAMGLLAPEDVPEVIVFEDQAQLGPGLVTPAEGTPISGPFRRITVNDLLAAHGPRSGPVPGEWRRALVLVSRDGLASPEEMDYWNFFAARLEDPHRTGVASYEGYVSIERSTDGRVDLQARLVPAVHPPVEQVHDVDFPPFGVRDCPDVVFEQPVPSHYVVREAVSLAARVLVRDRDYSQALLRFWKAGGTSDDAVSFWEPVSPSGSLTPRLVFREGEEGLYRLELFLFWPDAEPQHPRCSLTVVTVEAPAAAPLERLR